MSLLGGSWRGCESSWRFLEVLSQEIFWERCTPEALRFQGGSLCFSEGCELFWEVLETCGLVCEDFRPGTVCLAASASWS